MTMDNETPKRYAEVFNDTPSFDCSKSFYLHGGTGTGKTYFAWGLVNSRSRDAEREKEESMAKYFKNPDKYPKGVPYYDHTRYLVKNIPSLLIKYRSLDFAEKAYLIKSVCVGKIIFDDIGAEYQSDFSQEFILSVLDERWSKELWTGFTSNLTIGQLPYGDRIKSRIAGMVGKNIHRLDGKDRRLP